MVTIEKDMLVMLAIIYIMAYFSYWCSQIVIPELTHQTLSTKVDKIPLAGHY